MLVLFSYFKDKATNQIREGTMPLPCYAFVWFGYSEIKRPTQYTVGEMDSL